MSVKLECSNGPLMRRLTMKFVQCEGGVMGKCYLGTGKSGKWRDINEPS